LLPERTSKIKYEYLAEVYYNIFFKGTFDQPDPQHEIYVDKMKEILEQLYAACLSKLTKKSISKKINDNDVNRKLANNDSKNKAMKE